MTRLAYPGAGVALAALFAGPIFCLSSMLAFYYTQVPSAVPVDSSLFIGVWLVILAIPFGFFIAILPCLIGTAAMVSISAYPKLREPWVWGLVGGLMPLAGALYFEAGWSTPTFALSVTGAACAVICRRYTA